MTLRAEIRAHLVAADGGRLSAESLFELCPSAKSLASMVANINTLRGEKKLKRAGLDSKQDPTYAIDMWPEDRCGGSMRGASTSMLCTRMRRSWRGAVDRRQRPDPGAAVQEVGRSAGSGCHG
jgi:hypothetical protein